MEHSRARLIVVVAFAVLLILVFSGAAAMAQGSAIPAKDLKQATFIHYATGGPLAGVVALESAGPNYWELLDMSWPKTAFPLTFSVDTDGSPAGSFNQIQSAFATWDSYTSNGGNELFNPLILNRAVNPSTRVPDYMNTVSFRRLAAYPTALAITYLWYAPGKTIVDADIIVNTKFTWAVDPDDEGPLYATSKKAYYEVHNVMTHEVGHVVGLDDLYANAYSELTMYGYSATKETKKISLGQGDISGAQALYGP